MFKAFCDDCSRPIAPDDNHIAIQGATIINGGKVSQAQMLHFDGVDCMKSFFKKAENRPIIISPPSSTINGN